MSHTSRLAYYQLVTCGVLPLMRRSVYAALHNAGPQTANELFAIMQAAGLRDPSRANVTTRLLELREMGVVDAVGKRSGPPSGKLAIVWACNNNPNAKPIAKKATKQEKLAAALEAMYRLADALDVAPRVNPKALAAKVRSRASGIEAM